MAAQNGRDLRVKKKIGSTFVTVAGAQEETFSIENGEIDITDKDDDGRVARLSGGNTDISISISGVAKDEVLASMRPRRNASDNPKRGGRRGPGRPRFNEAEA